VKYGVKIKGESTVHQGTTWMFICFQRYCKAERGMFDIRFLRV